MKCKDAQRFLTGLTPETLAPDEVEEALRHVQACEECARFVAFNDQFKAALSTEPLLNPQLFGQIQGEIARNPRRQPAYLAWMRTIGGSNLMKRITLTAAAVAVLTIAGLGLFSGTAQAVEPKAKFDSMKAAVLAAAKSRPRGGQPGSTSAQAGASGDQTWILVSGQLIQPDPSGTTLIEGPGGAQLNIVTSGDRSTKNPNLRTGTPMIRTGSRLPKLSLDLDSTHYQAIAFGANSDTLVLTLKGNDGRRYLVDLNPKSALPVLVSLEQKKSGKWTRVRQAKVVI